MKKAISVFLLLATLLAAMSTAAMAAQKSSTPVVPDVPENSDAKHATVLTSPVRITDIGNGENYFLFTLPVASQVVVECKGNFPESTVRMYFCDGNGTRTSAKGETNSAGLRKVFNPGTYMVEIVSTADLERFPVEMAYEAVPFTSLFRFPQELKRFVAAETYPEGKFTDVKSTDWCADYVKMVYELGLVKGKTETEFNPSGNVTVAQTIAIAARMRSIYDADGTEFVQGEPWYQTYLDYALEKEIVTAGEYTKYDVAATRAQFATILYAALPEKAWVKINEVDTIPDVTYVGEKTDKAIYALYRAGVLTGSNEYGAFNPNSKIKRSEVAAIVARIAVTEERKFVSLKEYTKGVFFEESAYTVSTKQARKIPIQLVPEDAARNSVTWTSSDTRVAKVDASGNVLGVRSGVATITVTPLYGGLSTSCQVRVIATDKDAASVAYVYLSGMMKFPDSIRVYNTWASNLPLNGTLLTFETSALNGLGMRLRDFFCVEIQQDGVIERCYSLNSKPAMDHPRLVRW